MGVPALSEILTAILLVGGAAITLIGSAGLLRLNTFYERAHAPTLGTTLGTA
jgi:multicomponent K+:H+ antiporter subunit G